MEPFLPDTSSEPLLGPDAEVGEASGADATRASGTAKSEKMKRTDGEGRDDFARQQHQSPSEPPEPEDKPHDEVSRKDKFAQDDGTSMAALQAILASLERIERLLAGSQNETTRTERRQIPAQEDRNVSNIDSSEESGSSETDRPNSTVYSNRATSDVHCSVDQIPQYESLVGKGRSIPECGELDLFFTETSLQRRYPQQATNICKMLEEYISAVERCGNLARIYIMDFSYRKNRKKIDRFKTSHHVNVHLQSRLDSCFRYSRCLLTDLRSSRLEWGRLVILEGITTVKGTKTSQEPFLPPFLEIRHGIAEAMFNLHISCSDPSPNTSSTETFQLTFYELLHHLPMYDSWEHGRTYDTKTMFRKACLTFVILDWPRNATNAGWSIVLCAPSRFFESRTLYARETPGLTIGTENGHVTPYEAALRLLDDCLRIITGKWRNLWEELGGLIDRFGNATFMQPEEYVHLLYDEASFPRSRFYFWAIGCLSAFEDNLTTNIRQLKAFKREQLFSQNAYTRYPDSSLMQGLADSLDRRFQKLDDIAEEIKKKLGVLQALRDGLFSASGVMESRQSRVLGENVRLLTFVSIFFLPLGLIVAFWSVPDVNKAWPGIPTPICVSIIVGIITYLVVFNLNVLESLGRWILSYPRNYLIRKMSSTEQPSFSRKQPAQSSHKHNEGTEGRPKQSPVQEWQSRAKNFEVFPRPDRNPKPSDWWLFLFAMRLAFASLYNVSSKVFRNPSTLFGRPAEGSPTLPLHGDGPIPAATATPAGTGLDRDIGVGERQRADTNINSTS